MTIVFVTYEFPPEMATGGIATYTFHQVKLLVEQKHSIIVFSATLDQSKEGLIIRDGYKNYLVKAESNETFRSKVVDAFDALELINKVDVIESPEVGACALQIKIKYPHIPLIVKLHSPGVLITRIYNGLLPFRQRLRYVIVGLIKGRVDLGYWSRSDRNMYLDPEHLICELADKITSPSNALKNWAVKFWKLNPANIDIVGNPYTYISADLNNNNRHKRIIFLGKLTTLKGVQYMRTVVPTILKKYPDYEFVFVGKDAQYGRITMKGHLMAEWEQYSDRISFTGALSNENVQLLLKQSQICVVPSLWENYPSVILESLASGTVVVSTTVGGIPEIIEHAVDGLLVPPRSDKNIIKALDSLISDKSLREELATNGFNKVTELQRKLSEIPAIYRSVLDL